MLIVRVSLVDQILFRETEALCRFHAAENIVVFDGERIHFDPVFAIVVEIRRDRSLDVVFGGRAAVRVAEAETRRAARWIIFIREVVAEVGGQSHKAILAFFALSSMHVLFAQTIASDSVARRPFVQLIIDNAYGVIYLLLSDPSM